MVNYAINLEQTIGKFLPNVYLNRITLDNNAGFTQNRFQDNPHIDPLRASNTVEGARGKRRSREKPGDLVVTLQIAIKDIIGENFNKWFSNANTTLINGKTLKDYIKINIAQVTTKDGIKAWTTYMLDPASAPQLSPDQTPPAQQIAWDQTYFYTLPLKDFEGAAGRFGYPAFDSEGKSCINASLNIKSSDSGWVQFPVGMGAANPPLDNNPQYLAYFVWASVDIGQLAKDFRFNGTELQALISQFGASFPTIGKINSDIIFQDGKLVGTGYVFFEAQPSGDAPRLAAPPPSVTQGDIVSYAGTTPGLDLAAEEAALADLNTSAAPPATQPWGNTVLNKTDRLWNGNVHYYSNRDVQVYINGVLKTFPNYTGFMGGSPPTSKLVGGQYVLEIKDITEQPFLIQQAVPNTKIMDFRIVERIQQLNLNFSKLENKLLRIIDNNPRSVINNAKFSFFTDISLARDKKNDCRFFFGIDLKKIMRENSLYGGLFANLNWLQFAMNSARILSMKIFRRRLRGSSEGGSTPFNFPGDHHFDPVGGKLEKFNNGLKRDIRRWDISTNAKVRNIKGVSYDPSDELIIEAQESPDQRAFGGWVSLTFENKYRPDNLSEISSISNIFGAPVGTYYYTGTDGGMSEITDGYYQYRIELEIQDNTVDFLVELREQIQIMIGDLEKYFEEGSEAGRNPIKTRRSEDTHTAEFNLQASRTQVANFDPISNRFTQVFIDAHNGSTLWPSNVPRDYLERLRYFVDLNDKTVRELDNLLKSYINPQSGNLQGCMVLLRLLQDFMFFLGRAIGVQKNKPKLKKSPGQRNATGQTAALFESDIDKSVDPRRRSFKINHTFDSYFNANLPKEVGFDYLGAGMNKIPEFINYTGLRWVSANVFENIIVPKEKGKIFKDGPQNIELWALENKGLKGLNNSLSQTDFSYLTPSIIYTGPGHKFHTVTDEDGQRSSISPADTMNSTLFGTGIGTKMVWHEGGPADIYRGTLLSTDSLEEKVADFLSYGYNLSVVPMKRAIPKITTPQDRPIKAPADTIKKYMNRTNDQTNLNKDAFDALWSFMSNGIVSDNSSGGVAIPEGFNQKRIEYYNADNSDGFYKFLPTSPVTPPGEQSFVIINNLPNPIKALIRYNDQVLIVKGPQTINPFLPDVQAFLAGEPFTNSTDRAKARLMFETIGEIQVLTGFEDTKYGTEQRELEISEWKERGLAGFTFLSHAERQLLETTEASLSAPKWETLTRSIFNAADKKYLLCRIRSWESSIFKIKRIAGLSLPTYDEYFLLVGGGAALARDLPRQNPNIQEYSPTGLPEPDFAPDSTALFPGAAGTADFLVPPEYYTTNTTLAETTLTQLGPAQENIVSTTPADLKSFIAPETIIGSRATPPTGLQRSATRDRITPGIQPTRPIIPRPTGLSQSKKKK